MLLQKLIQKSGVFEWFCDGVSQHHATPPLLHIGLISNPRHVKVLHAGLQGGEMLRMSTELLQEFYSLFPRKQIVTAMQLQKT